MMTDSEPTITLTDEGDWWVARDAETGVASQGETREQALANLDEALAGVDGAGEEPAAEELEAVGVDPADDTADPDEGSAATE